MTLNAGVTTGSQGYLGVMTESIPGGSGTKGTPVVPTQDHFLPIDAPPTLNSKFDVAQNEVALSSVDTVRSMKNTKGKVAGAITYPLYLDYHEIAVAALGKDAWVTAVTADTFTAATVVTALAQSSLILVNGSSSYLPGAWVKIDTSTALEYRQIISYNVGTKTMVVAALSKAHTGTPAIQQIAQHQVTPFSTTSGLANLRRTLTIEENIGDEWAWQYAAAYVDKWDLKAAKDKLQVTATIMGDSQRLKMPTPTAISLGTQTETNLQNPYTYTDGFCIFGQDNTAAGSSVMQPALMAQDWSFALDNKMIEQALDDGTNFYRAFPGGKREIKIDYTINQQAARSSTWEDFVKANAEGAFMAGRYQVVGSTFYGFGIYVPNMHYLDAEDIRAFDQPVAEKVSCQARATGSTDVAQLFIVSSLSGSAY